MASATCLHRPNFACLQDARSSRAKPGSLHVQVGLLMFAPLFAEASKHYSAFRLMAVGLGAWILSTAGCALSLGQ